MPRSSSHAVDLRREAPGRVIRSVTPRVLVYGIISVVSLLAGLALGRPELVAIASPLVIGLAAGLVGVPKLGLDVTVEAERQRALEGELIDLFVTVQADHAVARLTVDPAFPSGLRLHHVEVSDDGPAARIERGRVIIDLVAGRPRQIRYVLDCRRWGGYPSMGLDLTTSDLLGLFRYTAHESTDLALKVFPRSEELQHLLTPRDTQLSAGELVSRRRGSGIEFSELRPFATGDDVRRVNWRASARRDELWINDRHPDHNGDVVLLVDTPVGNRQIEATTLDYTVRAVAALAQGHLGRRDRVGLIVFGGVLRWLRPTTAADQRYLILEALTDSRLRGGDQIMTALPQRALPAKALVIGLSPLLDADSVAAFAELGGRGTDLAIVEVDASRFVPEPESREQRLARRIWELQRDQTRRQFRRHRVAVAQWNPDEPFANPLGEVSAFRLAISRL